MKNCKMRINNPDHSKAVQKWLFREGRMWPFSEKKVIHTDKMFLYCDQNAIYFDNNWTSYMAHPYEEIDVSYLDPHLKGNNMKSPSLENMLKNLSHLEKAIKRSENKQAKRIQDRDRVVEKLKGMIPDGWELVQKGDTPISDMSKEFVSDIPCTPEHLKVGDLVEFIGESVWSCFTGGAIYTYKGKSEYGNLCVYKDDEGEENGIDWECFKFHSRPSCSSH